MLRLIIGFWALLTFPHAFALVATFGILGDAGHAPKAETRAVQASMQRAGVSHLILPGDNLYGTSTYAAVWGPWKAAGFSFDLVAAGNHTGGYAQEMRFFGMPGEYYSQTLVGGAARFIVLNSDNTRNIQQQMTFLEHELSIAREPFVFLVYHHPTYTLSGYHAWTEKREFQLALREKLRRYRSKITALIVGHDHLAMLAHFGDLPVVLAGAPVATRTDRGLNYTDPDGTRIATSWFFDGNKNWSRLTIDSQTSRAQVDFVRVLDGTVLCSVQLVTGQAATRGPNCQ